MVSHPHPAKAATVRFDAFPMDAPDDGRALRAQLAARPGADVVAAFAKTEGNGLDNDWSRPLAVRTLRDAFADAGLGEPLAIVSGGCEGFLTPHGLLVREFAGGVRGALVWSEPLPAHELGRAPQLEATAAALRQACAAGGLAPDAVRYAHVIAPWIEADRLGDAASVATDPHGSKPFTRAACALGAAVALDALPVDRGHAALARRDATVFGTRCAVTAGATGHRVGVLVFGDAPPSDDPHRAGQRIVRAVFDDPLAAADAHRLVPPGHRVVAAFWKGDPPPGGRLRGERIVLDHDSDVHAFRHYRAAMSGVLGAALRTTRLFIGCGAEHQCPAGGGLLAVVTEPDEASR